MINLFKKRTSYISFFDTHVVPEIESIKSLIISVWNKIYEDYPTGSLILEENDEDLNYAVCALMKPIFRTNWGIHEYALGKIIFDIRVKQIGIQNGWLDKNISAAYYSLSKDLWENRMSGSDIVIPIIKRLTRIKIKSTPEYEDFIEEAKKKFDISDFAEFNKNATEEQKKEWYDYLENNIPEGLITPQHVRDLYNVIALTIENPYRKTAKKLRKVIKKSAFDYPLREQDLNLLASSKLESEDSGAKKVGKSEEPFSNHPRAKKASVDLKNIDCVFFNAFDSEEEREEFIQSHFKEWWGCETEIIKQTIKEKGKDGYLKDTALIEGYDSIPNDMKKDVLKIAKDKGCTEEDVAEAYDLYKEYLHRLLNSLGSRG